MALLTLIIVLIEFRYFLKLCNSSLLVWFFARQYFRYVLFLLLIEVSMPFVIQGFALSFRSLTDIFFNGACSAMIELTVVMKDSKDLSTSPLFTSRIVSQIVLMRVIFIEFFEVLMIYFTFCWIFVN